LSRNNRYIKNIVAEGISGAEIYRRLFAVFKRETLSHSRMFKWCTRFHSRRQSVSDGDRACEQHSADSNKNDCILIDRHVTVRTKYQQN